MGGWEGAGAPCRTREGAAASPRATLTMRTPGLQCARNSAPIIPRLDASWLHVTDTTGGGGGRWAGWQAGAPHEGDWLLRSAARHLRQCLLGASAAPRPRATALGRRAPPRPPQRCWRSRCPAPAPARASGAAPGCARQTPAACTHVQQQQQGAGDTRVSGGQRHASKPACLLTA